EGSRSQPPDGASTRPTYKSFQSEGVPSSAVGHAFYDGDNDHRWGCSHTRDLDSTASPHWTGRSVALFQRCSRVEGGTVHDPKQYAHGRSRPLASMSLFSRITNPVRRHSAELTTPEEVDAFIDSRALEYPTKIEDGFVERALALGVESGMI